MRLSSSPFVLQQSHKQDDDISAVFLYFSLPYSGNTVAFSEDGKVLAVGAGSYDQNAGAAYVYALDKKTKEYVQVAGPLSPASGCTNAGVVTLNKKGTELALGGPNYQDNNKSGAVWYYRLSKA